MEPYVISVLIDIVMAVAKQTSKKIDVLVSIGIGGSYLGGRTIDEINNDFGYEGKIGSPKIVYLGHNLSPNFITSTLNYLKKREFGICVVSKSGGTIETLVSFWLARNLLINMRGESICSERIVVVTNL